MQIDHLTPTFGVRVDADPAQLGGQAIGELVAEHAVVFFAPSDLDDDTQKQLLDELGSPYVHPLAIVAGVTEATASHIVDDADHPPYQDQWHTDVTWDPERPSIGSLRAIEMPEVGGDTVWADVVTALETLPEPLRAEIDDLVALHDMGRGTSFASKAGQDIADACRARYPGVERPIVGRHRISGQRFLDVNAGFTNHIVGYDDDASRALLDQLFTHVADHAPKVRHEWTVGEFVVWDEQLTQHSAMADHYPARREMSRYVVR